MVTLFALPKPFEGHNGVIQRNALQSWTRMMGNPQLILLGDDAGVPETAAELGLEYGGPLERTEFGTPRLDHLFNRGQELARHDLVVYCNADIILAPDFPLHFKQIGDHFENFLMIGQRWDLDITEPIDFNDPDWMMQQKARIMREGCLHRHSGVDYFAFRKGLYPTIPPMAVGRVAWDNWLVMEAGRQNAAVVDASDAIFAIHQNHDYAHGGGYQAVWKGNDAQRNLKLAGMKNGLAGWIQNAATWRLLPGKLVPAAKTPPVDDIARASAEWPTYLKQATTLIEQGKAQQVLALLTPLQNAFGHIEEYHYIRAIALAHGQKIKEAVDACNAALRINPGSKPIKDLMSQLGVQPSTTWSQAGPSAQVAPAQTQVTAAVAPAPAAVTPAPAAAPKPVPKAKPRREIEADIDRAMRRIPEDVDSGLRDLQQAFEAMYDHIHEVGGSPRSVR